MDADNLQDQTTEKHQREVYLKQFEGVCSVLADFGETENLCQ